MTPFPHHYTVQLANRRLYAPPRESIALGAPPQFDGSDRDWSPEELLVGAALECLWTTFEAIARRSRLVVHEFSGTASGVLERGTPVAVFASIDLHVDLRVDAGNEERARALLTKAEQNCIVSHALNVPVKVVAEITSATPHSETAAT